MIKQSMKHNPFVSIIIVSYNGMYYLKDCLDSILDQSYPQDQFEIIIADNNSTDNSVNFLKSNYDSVKILEFKTNHGFAKGNNLAAEHAKGDMLAFLNQDTIVHKEWLSALVKGVYEENYDVCQSNMLFPRNEEFEKAHRREFPQKVYFYELTKYGYVNQIIREFGPTIIQTKALAGGSFIIKRSVLNQLEYLFDEKFGMYNEDTDLALRIAKKGFKIGVVPSSVVYHFTKFSFKFNSYNIWKNLIMMRNRLIAYFKALEKKEFLCFLPYLIISQSHKTFTRSVEINNGLVKSIFLSLCIIPLSIVSLIWFLFSMRL